MTDNDIYFLIDKTFHEVKKMLVCLKSIFNCKVSFNKEKLPVSNVVISIILMEPEFIKYRMINFFSQIPCRF